MQKYIHSRSTLACFETLCNLRLVFDKSQLAEDLKQQGLQGDSSRALGIGRWGRQHGSLAEAKPKPAIHTHHSKPRVAKAKLRRETLFKSSANLNLILDEPNKC